MNAQELYSKLKNVSHDSYKKWTLKDCEEIAPIIEKINELKSQNDAVILAHSYTLPEIVYGVADYVGDSYELSQKASQVKEKNIIFAGVYFMAETAKIISPNKTVIIPAGKSGCSLADSITAEELKTLKAKYPQASVVCYINSNAEVKAECDVCVTSSNVYDIISKMPKKQIIFVPDSLMAENIKVEFLKRGVEKEIISSEGSCCVHDRFLVQDVEDIKQKYPDAQIITHPESRPEVCAMCDFVGGTGSMLKYVKESAHKQFAVLTERGLVNRLEFENPDKQIVGPIAVCGHMKRNTLEDIYLALVSPLSTQIVEVDKDVAEKAKKSINKMFEMVERK